MKIVFSQTVWVCGFALLFFSLLTIAKAQRPGPGGVVVVKVCNCAIDCPGVQGCSEANSSKCGTKPCNSCYWSTCNATCVCTKTGSSGTTDKCKCK